MSIPGVLNHGTLENRQPNFIWTVEDLLVNIPKSEYGLESPDFFMSTNDILLKWRAYTALINDTNGRKFVVIALFCLNAYQFNGTIDIKVLNALNDKVFNASKSNIKLNSGLVRLCEIFPVERIINTKDCSKKLKIIFSLKNSKQSVELLQTNDSNPLKNLFNSKQFSDVTFNVEGKELYAYKGILAIRSPVFTAMFSHNMTEAKWNYVDISDISYNTMYNLFRYMYTELEPQFECDEDEENCKSLLIAADKYGVENLKLGMEKKLSLYIKVCNVFEYLNFADLYNTVVLKQEAIEFIISHNDEMAGSEVYKNFRSLHPDVACEVFRSLLIKKRKLE